MNHYPRHVGDITRDTFGLSLTEFGAYDRLLDAYYATEKPLPLDQKERYRMAGAVAKADRAAVDYVVPRYFTEQVDGWHQKRADAELSAYQERAEQARKNGANGGRPRNRNETDPVTSANPEVTGLKANQEPVTSNQEPITPEVQERWQSLPKPATLPALKKANGINGNHSPQRATRLPDEWFIPDEWRDWAVTVHKLEPQRAVRISLDFRDYWHAKGGADACKRDWLATWRRWVRKECGDA